MQFAAALALILVLPPPAHEHNERAMDHDDAEECDLADKNGSGDAPSDSVPCDSGCRHAAALIFLSSIPLSAADLYSAKGADQRCQEFAAAAQLPNAPAFKAWISDSFTTPLQRFAPATPGLPYALRNGLRVAKDRAALLTTGPETAIAITETGTMLYKALVWTATNSDGTRPPGDLDCEDWTTASPLWKAGVGFSGVNKAWNTWKAGDHWTTFMTINCKFKYHLYCMEQ